MRPRAELIRELVDELAPVRRALAPGALAGLWLLGSWLLVSALTLATGPLRPDLVSQLAASPRFLLESLLGLVAGAATVLAMARLGIPSPASLPRQLALALLLLFGWIGAYAYGLLDPALSPSMLGKRELCYLQTALFGVAPLGLGLWLVRRSAPLSRAWTGAVAGAAAASLPALMMQFACMYVPAHILTHHIAPIAVLALLGALLGRATLRPV